MIVIYRFLILVLGPFYLLSILFSKKTRDHINNRPGSFDLDTSSKKTIWIHASSGEFEHAKYLIKSLKEKDPSKKIILTYSSPSYVYAIQKDPNLDGYLPMPFDFKGPVSSIIRKINPEMVLFARTDVWPELAHQLKKKGIPSLVFARAENRKKSFLKKIYYKMTLLQTSQVSFVTERDKGKFVSLLGKHAGQVKLSVDGDPRVDEVFDKIENHTYKRVNEDKDKTIILGSVWSEDLDVIAEPLRKALEKGSISKIIIAPHDPSPAHILEIKNYFKDISTDLYSEDSSFESTLTIVDKVGLLFDLYSEAKVAFIGGSFKDKVHSVLEPLAKGLPVLTGPKIGNNSEAQTYSKKPYEFVKVCKDSPAFQANLKSALGEDSFEIEEAISMQKGSSVKIEEQMAIL